MFFTLSPLVPETLENIGKLTTNKIKRNWLQKKVYNLRWHRPSLSGFSM